MVHAQCSTCIPPRSNYPSSRASTSACGQGIRALSALHRLGTGAQLPPFMQRNACGPTDALNRAREQAHPQPQKNSQRAPTAEGDAYAHQGAGTGASETLLASNRLAERSPPQDAPLLRPGEPPRPAALDGLRLMMLTGTVRGNAVSLNIRHALLRAGNPERQAAPYRGANALAALRKSSCKLLTQTADALAQEVTLCSQMSQITRGSAGQPNLMFSEQKLCPRVEAAYLRRAPDGPPLGQVGLGKPNLVHCTKRVHAKRSGRRHARHVRPAMPLCQTPLTYGRQ